MTRWVEDASLEAPDGHRWLKPAPEDCPNCGCHTARVCAAGRQSEAPATNADGTPWRGTCPCEKRPTACHPNCPTGGPCLAGAQRVLREALAVAFPGPAPDCCGHITCKGTGAPFGEKVCGYVIAGLASGSVRCECVGSPG